MRRSRRRPSSPLLSCRPCTRGVRAPACLRACVCLGVWRAPLSARAPAFCAHAARASLCVQYVCVHVQGTLHFAYPLALSLLGVGASAAVAHGAVASGAAGPLGEVRGEVK